jgi:hypothetical protein
MAPGGGGGLGGLMGMLPRPGQGIGAPSAGGAGGPGGFASQQQSSNPNSVFYDLSTNVQGNNFRDKGDLIKGMQDANNSRFYTYQGGLPAVSGT